MPGQLVGSVWLSVGIMPTDPHFIEARVQKRLSTKNNFCPTSKEFSDYFTFEQDSACSPCKWNCRSVQSQDTFIQPSLWPPNSPDLNPVEFLISLQDIGDSSAAGLQPGNPKCGRVATCSTRERVDQREINNAVKKWHRHLRSCMAAKSANCL